MADTWPVDNGSVGEQSSSEAAARPTRSFGTFNADGIVQGPGQSARPGSRSAPTPTTQSSIADSTSSATSGNQDTVGIVDSAGNTVPPTIDTFLQSLTGSLSTILRDLANNLFEQLPSIAQDLLSGTALASVLGGAIDQLSSEISGAIGELASSLQEAAGTLINNIGNAIDQIPGIGPALQDFASAAGDLVQNFNTAFESLPDGIKSVVSDVVNQIGTNILSGNETLSNIASLFSPIQASEILQNINFPENPVSGIQRVALQARELDTAIFENTGNTVFANLSARASEGASQLQRAIEQSGTGTGFVFRNTIPESISENVQQVINGQITEADNFLRSSSSYIRF